MDRMEWNGREWLVHLPATTMSLDDFIALEVTQYVLRNIPVETLEAAGSGPADPEAALGLIQQLRRQRHNDERGISGEITHWREP